LTPERDTDAQFDEKVDDINALYQQAPDLAKKGESVMRTDELTGVQALERKHPGLPLAPGKVERREFEYLRHGTLSFIVNFEVATGQVATVACASTRTEEDFAQHIQRTVETCRRSPNGILSWITSTFISPNPWCGMWPANPI
jgi:putative transposase